MSPLRSLAWLAVPLLGVSLLTGVWVRQRLWPSAALAVRVAPGPLVAEVLGVGTLESPRAVPVSFEAAGRVIALSVEEGAAVEEGAILGALDTDDARRELSVADANTRAARAAVARARAELARGAAVWEQARADLARADTLFAGGALPAADQEAAARRATSAAAEVRALEAALSQAIEAQASAAQAQTVRVASVQDGLLHSPLTGLVLTRAVEVGQVVAPGAPAFVIAATEGMEVHAWVEEAALGALALGQPATLTFRSAPSERYPGHISQIRRVADRLTHEVQVEIRVASLPPNYAVGQRVDAYIEVGRRDDALTVPRGWCSTTCVVAEGGVAVARPVTLGLLGRDAVEVRSGLTTGDVVLSPQTPLGARVRPVLEAP